MSSRMIVSGLLIAATMQTALAEQVKFKTQQEMLSYGIGVSVARNLKKQGSDMDMDLLVRGLKDGMSGKPLLIPEKDLRKLMNAYQSEVRQRMQKDRRVAQEENRKREEAFLEKNKAEKDVVALPSGLQYRILKAGTGRKPTEADLIECNYRGTLLDGTEFDATEAGHPATLKLSALITGWKEALKLMPEGSRWQIFIPAKLAYGERGVGTEIGPNETLQFDVELLAIKQ
ncbi:FKBP-type peptidyl-prolyl cis-trans isomerase [Ferriphaselus sp. R-1]|uniref:FKBP-type peptidyl-prolyl cis-trans isomerase N-terminal domain-containing protein n=1 Tax=Ferriphaselus sp. R-1 TaxID=1485544 RepID=UPI00054DEA23|nr:FKBP-type peptidyl-prolyl cis-trans isomerase [Ferriphaselus sp. R-1]